MHLAISMYYPTTSPSGLSGALLGELTQNYCPTIMGHLTKAYRWTNPFKNLGMSKSNPHVVTGAYVGLHWGI